MIKVSIKDTDTGFVCSYVGIKDDLPKFVRSSLEMIGCEFSFIDMVLRDINSVSSTSFFKPYCDIYLEIEEVDCILPKSKYSDGFVIDFDKVTEDMITLNKVVALIDNGYVYELFDWRSLIKVYAIDLNREDEELIKLGVLSYNESVGFVNPIKLSYFSDTYFYEGNGTDWEMYKRVRDAAPCKGLQVAFLPKDVEISACLAISGLVNRLRMVI